MQFEKLFSPIKLRGLELKNRVLMPGMDTKLAHDHIGDEVIAYHVARVKGGCALNMFECTAVHITSRSKMNLVSIPRSSATNSRSSPLPCTRQVER